MSRRATLRATAKRGSASAISIAVHGWRHPIEQLERRTLLAFTAPAGVDLLPASDSGVSDADDITNLNNTAGKTLSFAVSGTVEGTTVDLYANGTTLIGTAASSEGTTTVVTNGAAALSDGLHAITAVQGDSPASPALNVTIDTTAPGIFTGGSLDTSFGGGDGIVVADYGANRLALQTDGKIVAISGTAITRYNTDGTLDATFGGGDGVVDTAPRGLSDVVLQPDGKIVVVGTESVDNNPVTVVMRFHSNGTLDSTFGDGDGIVEFLTGFRGSGTHVALQPDGKILVESTFTVSFDTYWSVYRLNSDGSRDFNFSSNGEMGLLGPSDLWVQSNGKIVTGGYYVNFANGSTGIRLTRSNNDGTRDTSFGDNGVVITHVGSSTRAFSLVLQPDERIIVAGEIVQGSTRSLAVMRYTINGSLDNTFGGGDGIAIGGNGTANDVGLLPDGRIIAIGTSGNSSGVSNDIMVSRFFGDGTLDRTFGSDGIATTDISGASDQGRAMLLQPDGKIIVAAFASPHSVLVRYGGAAAVGLLPSSDSGVSDTDNITNHTTPSFMLPSHSGDYFRFYRDGAQISGDWEAATGAAFTAPAQPEGALAYTARVLDAAGNESVPSTLLTVTIDTTAPAAPASPALLASSDSGISDSDNITNDATPTFDLPSALEGYLRVYRSGTQVGANWDITGGVHTLPQQPNGTFDYTIREADLAGNPSAPSDSLTVTIDTIAPATPAAPDLLASSDSGASDSDNITNDTTPTFAVSGEPYFRVYRDAVQISQNWESGAHYTTSAQPGEVFSWSVAAADTAGNISAPSNALAVTIDTIAPAAPAAPDLLASSDSGASDSDNITNDATPTFGLSALSGDYLRVYRSGTQASGDWEVDTDGTFTLEAQPDGSFIYTVRNVDVAGNLSVPSPGLAATIDTDAPTIMSPIFEFEARQVVSFEVSESLGGTLTLGDMSLFNLTTAQNVPSSAIALAIDDNHYRLTFFLFANGVLPDGNYVLSIPASAASDVAGNSLAAGLNLDFFVLAGDANRDRVVDVADLGILASNWQQSPRTFSQADFSYDAAVNVLDLGILASSWQKRLDPPSFSFSAAAFPAGSLPHTAKLVDINGDARPELVIANQQSAGYISVLVNTTPTGATTPQFASAQTFAVGSLCTLIDAADFNLDGRLDIAVSNAASDTISVLLNTTAPGSATVSFAQKVDLAVGSRPRALVAADINQDGKPDLVSTNQWADTISVLMNTTPAGGAVASFAPKQDVTVGDGPVGIAAGDLNNDNRLDLAVINEYSGDVSVLLNSTSAGSATATFSGSQQFDTGPAPRGVTITDLNADGKLDVAVANSGLPGMTGSLSVLLNNTSDGATSPSLATAQDFTSGTNPIAISTGDLDGDGQVEIVVANFGGDSVSVFRNDTTAGSGIVSLINARTIPVGGGPIYVDVGDINSDGESDLAVANFIGSSISVLTNASTPVRIAGSVAPLAPSRPHSTGRIDGSIAEWRAVASPMLPSAAAGSLKGVAASPLSSTSNSRLIGVLDETAVGREL